MRTINTIEAVGTILCHDLTRIVEGVVRETAFRKGHVVAEEDLPILLSMGKTRLYVWDPGPNMVHENEAAEALADLCSLRDGFDLSIAKEGKIELSAKSDGLFLIDSNLLDEINDHDEIAVAARHGGVQVKAGDKVAALKIVPLAVPRDALDRIGALALGRPLMRVEPYVVERAAIVATGSEIFNGRIKDAFTPVVEAKIAEYGARTIMKSVCDDDAAHIASKILASKEAGAELVVCTGGMSVDPDDLTPGAVKASGAEIVCYGTPVLPGAMFLVAYLENVPVLCLPGCVMYGKRTVFDVLMPRIAAGRRITRREIRRLGKGGLCLSCPSCVFPACGFGRGFDYSL